jgi:aryl-alcohol dehydrogenase-like predicted oxidoreductase
MGRAIERRLILGGHSFISQLGNDPPAPEHEQRRIVEACLDRGIRWFDTTYQPERVALGNILHALGRRDQATILAWNFFTDFAAGDDCGLPECYRSGHIDVILRQLRTSYVDGLVLVPSGDVEENRRQIDLMIEWRRKGYVRFLGLWTEDRAMIDCYRRANPFQFAIRPFNIATEGAAPAFSACKRAGWGTIATSPFDRGWEVDRIVAEGAARGYGEPKTLRPVVVDLMLRFSLFQRDVDGLIVAMRRVAWVTRNVESAARGPLTARERRFLRRLRGLSAPRGRRSWPSGIRAGMHRLWRPLRHRP